MTDSTLVQSNTPHLVARGVLRVRRGEVSRYVMVDVNLGRIAGLTLQGISRYSVVTDPEVLPQYTEVPMGQTTAHSEVAEPTADGTTDWLALKLLDKPIEELGLQDQTCLELWNLEVMTVRDLLAWSEKDLGASNRGNLTGGKISSTSLTDILERLSYYDLKLTSKSKVSSGRRTRQDWVAIHKEQDSVTPEEARQTLGHKDYELFQIVASGTPKEFLEARNELTVKHRGLAAAYAYQRVNARMFLRDRDRQQWDQYNELVDADDLYQAGCLGLMRAVEGFNSHAGSRFSTYAMWSVRQAVNRMIEESQGIPAHLGGKFWSIAQAKEALTKRLRREPTNEELASELDTAVEDIILWQSEKKVLYPSMSLDDPGTSDGGDPVTLGDLIPDYREKDASHRVDLATLRDAVQRVVRQSRLLEAERRTLDLFFGLFDGYPRTYEQVGNILGVTRERVRQRLESALPKLQTEDVWETLSPFLDRAQPFGASRPGMGWELTYQAWQAVRDQWDDRWTPGTALYQTCLWYGVALSDVLQASDDEKRQPLSCLLMAICHDIFQQSFVAIADRFAIPDLVAQRCCRRCHENFRRLNPLFDGLKLKDPEPEEIAERVEKELGASNKRVVDPRALIAAVCSYYAVAIGDLVGTSKRQEVTWPRQVAMYLLQQETQLPLPLIGQQFDRHHTTVIYAYKKVSQRLAHDARLLEDIKENNQKMNSGSVP